MNSFFQDKWVNLFPTIVSKAETTKVLERGFPGSRSGALQLVYIYFHENFFFVIFF